MQLLKLSSVSSESVPSSPDQPVRGEVANGAEAPVMSHTTRMSCNFHVCDGMTLEQVATKTCIYRRKCQNNPILLH